MGRNNAKTEEQLQKEQVEEANKENKKRMGTWERILDKKRALGDKLYDFADERHRDMVASVRLSRMDDFREICGSEEVDYDNPHVRILWIFCDPMMNRWVTNPRKRDRVYEELNRYGVQDTYCNYVDDHGHTYQQIFEKKLQHFNAYRYRRKEDKEQKKLARQ